MKKKLAWLGMSVMSLSLTTSVVACGNNSSEIANSDDLVKLRQELEESIKKK